MKHLKRIFESGEDDIKYILDCFLDISENSNFKVSELIDENQSERIRGFSDEIVYKLKISLGDSLSLPQPVNSNLYIGMVKTDLEFLRNKNKAMLDLFDDIEVAIERIKDKFQNSEVRIESNRREEIDILIFIRK